MTHPTTTDSAPVDPVRTEIIRENLVAITDEMKTNLMRTAYNQIIYEAQDFTVGLFDAEGNTVSIGLGLPMFVGGLSQSIRAKLAHFGADGIEPGDVLLTNDAYIMGSHLNHMILTLPIFAEGRIIAFASSMAHWLDVGGVLGGVTTDIYSEGLQLPIVKLFKRGVQDDELTRIIEMNVRFSDLALGDLRAQIAAVRTGEARLTELVERYGADAVTGTFTTLFDRSERLARSVVESIPDGVYEAETAMDDDGVSIGRAVPIKVRVEVAGDLMTIDLSEVSPEVAGYFNSGETAGRSAAQVAFKCLTSPGDFPINEGAFRPVEVILPPGRVISARKPAAMRWWMTYPMTVVDCILRALSDAVPTGGIAGHHADLAISQFYGAHPDTGRLFMFMPGAPGGGWGATAGKDGEDATICVNDGDTHNTPVEANEARFGFAMCEEYSLLPDSGGPGRRRGGLGVRQAWTLDIASRVDTFMERTVNAPWGIAGGDAAAPNRISVVRADASTQTFPNGKLAALQLQAHDRLVIDTGGGGGYGPAHDRPVEEVLADVQAGLVSTTAARETYGVVVTRDAAGAWSAVAAPGRSGSAVLAGVTR